MLKLFPYNYFYRSKISNHLIMNALLNYHAFISLKYFHYLSKTNYFSCTSAINKQMNTYIVCICNLLRYLSNILSLVACSFGLHIIRIRLIHLAKYAYISISEFMYMHANEQYILRVQINYFVYMCFRILMKASCKPIMCLLSSLNQTR